MIQKGIAVSLSHKYAFQIGENTLSSGALPDYFSTACCSRLQICARDYLLEVVR